MRVLALAIVLLLASPTVAGASHTTTHVRCTALTRELNERRSPDVRLMYLLCQAGRARADYILRTGDRRHSFALVRRYLTQAGVCWTNIGEVLATTNHQPPLSAYIIGLWRNSAPHWDVLRAGRYDRGGGSWVVAGGRAQAVYYVLDTC